MLFVALIALIVSYRYMKITRYTLKQPAELRKILLAFHQANKVLDLEVDRSRIELYETLGEGAFGIVRKGTLKPQHRASYNRKWLLLRQLQPNRTETKHCIDVAVKMVKRGNN